MKLNVHQYLKRTAVEGPGDRFCIWVQGCSMHCDGCRAPKTWAHGTGTDYEIEFLFEMIKKEYEEKGKIEGVTFLGGEPFEQAQALGFLAERVKNIGLSVLTFTGLTYSELIKKNDEAVNRLLKYTDLLIDGPFKKEKHDLSRPWTGSANQRYIFLSDRYSPADIDKYKNKMEVRIDKNGFLFINGMGDFDRIESELCLLKTKK